MKYITEYRDKELAKKLVADIAKEARPDRNYRLMEFCGGHTHVISRYGLEGILPKNVRMIHGPGCPVCVMPIGRIDSAIELALEHGVILCTYADTMRVPASKGLSLMKAKAQGGDIRMIYSAADCLDIARANPDRNVVFFAIGFETTTPATAAAICSQTSCVTHCAARPQQLLSSAQPTGAREPSRTRRISPTVYSSGFRVSR